MLGFRELGEAVRLLNIVSEKFLGFSYFICENYYIDSNLFSVFNSATNRNESFSTFCDNFCTLNEPIRHFYVTIFFIKAFLML